MGNFCKYCGARVDGKTGLCPNCDAGQLRARRRQRNMIWIIAAVAVIAAAVLVILFAWQSWWRLMHRI